MRFSLLACDYDETLVRVDHVLYIGVIVAG